MTLFNRDTISWLLSWLIIIGHTKKKWISIGIVMVPFANFKMTYCRMIIVYPDSFSVYPPIFETHFASWSPVFSNVSGKLIYFPNTCQASQDKIKNNTSTISSANGHSNGIKSRNLIENEINLQLAFPVRIGKDSYSNLSLDNREKYNLERQKRRFDSSVFESIKLFDTSFVINSKCSIQKFIDSSLKMENSIFCIDALHPNFFEKWIRPLIWSSFPLNFLTYLYVLVKYIWKNHLNFWQVFEISKYESRLNSKHDSLNTCYYVLHSDESLLMYSNRLCYDNIFPFMQNNSDHMKKRSILSRTYEKISTYFKACSPDCFEIADYSPSSKIELETYDRKLIYNFSSQELGSPRMLSEMNSSKRNSEGIDIYQKKEKENSENEVAFYSSVNPLPLQAAGAIIRRELQSTTNESDSFWIFDQCLNEADIFSIIDAANTKKIKGVIFTNTTFKEYNISRSSTSFLPRPVMPVFSIPKSNLEQELKTLLSKGRTVDVFIDNFPADYIDCTLDTSIKILTIILIPLWSFIAIAWHIFINYVPTVSVTLLHRWMLIPPILKLFFETSSLILYLGCPSYTIQSAQYMLMTNMGFNTVFNSVFYGLLLLLSKGFTVTRELLERKESLSIALMVSMVYIITSLSQVNPEGTVLALVIMSVWLLTSMLISINQILRRLQIRLSYIQIARVEGWEAAVSLKIYMFSLFRIIMVVYFSLEIIFYLLLFTKFSVISEVGIRTLEWLLWLAVCIIFRPRHQLLYFSFMQNSMPTILPMYATAPLNQEITVPQDDNNSALTSLLRCPTEQPVVILNPGEVSEYYGAYSNITLGRAL